MPLEASLILPLITAIVISVSAGLGQRDSAVLLLAQIKINIVHLPLYKVECDHLFALRGYEDKVSWFEGY